METEHSFKIDFIYLKEHFNAAVSFKRYPKGYAVYKLILKSQKFWLINNEEEWRFIGDIELCQRLKNVVVRKIKQAVTFNDQKNSQKLYGV